MSTERLAVVETEMKYVKVEMTEMKEDIKVVKDAVSSMSSLVNEKCRKTANWRGKISSKSKLKKEKFVEKIKCLLSQHLLQLLLVL